MWLGIIFLDIVLNERLIFSVYKSMDVMPRSTMYNLIGENVYF